MKKGTAADVQPPFLRFDAFGVWLVATRPWGLAMRRRRSRTDGLAVRK
jgi:hypothetical protein